MQVYTTFICKELQVYNAGTTCNRELLHIT